MLERYDDYFKKAKLFTSIHAKQQQIQKPNVITNSEKETSGETKGIALSLCLVNLAFF